MTKLTDLLRSERARHEVQAERMYARLDDAARARLEAECVRAVSAAIARPAGSAGVATSHVEA